MRLLFVALAFAVAACDSQSMGLPFSRELTATAASGVPSAAFNVMQDCIIGGKHGDIWVPVNVRGAGFAPSGTPPSVPANVVTFLAAAPVGATYEIGLSFGDGTQIKALKWVAQSSTGTEDATLRIKYAQFAGANFVGGANLATQAMVNIPAVAGAAWTAYTVAAGLPILTVHDTQIWIEITRDQNNGGFIQLQQLYAQIARP